MLFQDYKSRQDPDGPKRINLGIWDVAVCVLVMEAYKEKETGWKVGDVLKALWQMFHDSQARRAELH